MTPEENTGAAGLHRTGDIAASVLSDGARFPMCSAATHAAHRCLLTGPRIFSDTGFAAAAADMDVHRPHRQRRTTHTPCGAGYSACVHAHAVSFPLLYPHSSAARLAVGTLLSAIITPHTVEGRRNTPSAAAIFVIRAKAPHLERFVLSVHQIRQCRPTRSQSASVFVQQAVPPDTGSPSVTDRYRRLILLQCTAGFSPAVAQCRRHYTRRGRPCPPADSRHTCPSGRYAVSASTRSAPPRRRS